MKIISTLIVILVLITTTARSQETSSQIKTTRWIQCNSLAQENPPYTLLTVDGVQYELAKLKMLNPDNIASIEIRKEIVVIGYCTVQGTVIAIATKPVVVRFTCRAQLSATADSEPLLVIDGLPYDFNELKTLKSNEIESVTVLKDASALAIYGHRAAHGVIIVTTKKASQRKFIVKDFLTRKVVPNATICFTNGNESITAIANDSGIVITDKLKGGIQFHVAVSSAGYKTFSTIAEGKQQEILLERDVKECSPVIISSTECPHAFHCGMSVVVTREKLKPVPVKDAITVKPVYPNPVLRSNVFNLDLDSELGGTIQLSVISMNGGIVFFQSQKTNKGLNHITIAADAKWSAGIYNIQLRNENGTLVRQEKLIVQ